MTFEMQKDDNIIFACGCFMNKVQKGGFQSDRSKICMLDKFPEQKRILSHNIGIFLSSAII